jgi:hypothetical protein
VKFKSNIITQASGSVGGSTFAHNQGGLYIRARSIPTNPSTAQQQAVRNALTALTGSWTSALTQAQRDAWTTYATNVPIIGTLGDSRKISGLSMYVRCNVPRLQAGVSRIDTAPTTFTLGTLTNPTVTASATSPQLSIAFTNTDAWATAAGGYMLVYASRGQSAGINFFKGPYQYAGKITGASTPPTTPKTIVTPFALTAGQKVFIQAVATLADGRLTAPFRAGVTVA